jgi:acetyltransferase-like isoleucine patch superfamily enzyme
MRDIGNKLQKLIGVLLRSKDKHNGSLQVAPQIQAHTSSYGLENIKVETWNDSCTVNIGKYCSIGSDIRVILGGHNSNWITTFPFGDRLDGENMLGDRKGHPAMYGDVNIGNDVWIGSKATILGGNSIGDGAIVAAGSHVVCDIPPYAIFGGNPAKLIRMRFTPEIVEELTRIKWWDYSESQIRTISNLLCQPPSTLIIGKIRGILDA